ncbi:MAG: type III pantothenate kinase [Planctomycetes bacterium]|nr:type III pantothenate kinase [Planctomycetota bacterium]
MTVPAAAPMVAVDVGNSRMKFGLFECAPAEGLPAPCRTLDLPALGADLAAVSAWALPRQVSEIAWYVGSVHRAASTRLVDWLQSHNTQPPITLLASIDLPLVVSLERPDMVGIDRLLDGVAANMLRERGRAAVVIDLGTAITVDLLSEDGTFLGGAILPGIGMSARALHEFTDLLPLIDMTALAAPPPALGMATREALCSGLYWGAVGGVRELIGRLTAGRDRPPQVFLSGGAAASVAGLLSDEGVYVPHLTLSGIALAAWR